MRPIIYKSHFFRELGEEDRTVYDFDPKVKLGNVSSIKELFKTAKLVNGQHIRIFRDAIRKKMGMHLSFLEMLTRMAGLSNRTRLSIKLENNPDLYRKELEAFSIFITSYNYWGK